MDSYRQGLCNKKILSYQLASYFPRIWPLGIYDGDYYYSYISVDAFRGMYGK